MLLLSSAYTEEGAIISVALCMLPYRSDCIFFNYALSPAYSL